MGSNGLELEPHIIFSDSKSSSDPHIVKTWVIIIIIYYSNQFKLFSYIIRVKLIPSIHTYTYIYAIF